MSLLDRCMWLLILVKILVNASACWMLNRNRSDCWIIMETSLQFPTPYHEQAAETAYTFFHSQAVVDTVLVVNSCARGQAVAESDLDMAVLVLPETPEVEIARLEALWRRESKNLAGVQKFRSTSKNAYLHLNLITGQYSPQIWDEGGGPDSFEIDIGNQIAYAAPLHEVGAHYRRLQAQWLRYYAEDLRQQRLAMVRTACAYDLDQVIFFVRRELYFQAFDRLYKAFQEFLQALFITRRVYPLAYNKWIRYQVAEWLGLPDLYQALPAVISVRDLESDELLSKVKILEDLLETWTKGPASQWM
jgi:hypothetical protein